MIIVLMLVLVLVFILRAPCALHRVISQRDPTERPSKGAHPGPPLHISSKVLVLPPQGPPSTNIGHLINPSILGRSTLFCSPKSSLFVLPWLLSLVCREDVACPAVQREELLCPEAQHEEVFYLTAFYRLGSRQLRGTKL